MSIVKKCKGIFSFVTIFALLIAFSSECKAEASFVPDIEKIYSNGVYMVNLESDVVVYSKNENEKMWPASITKIMTAIIVLENCPDLKAYVRIGYDAFNEFWGDDPNKQNPSNVALEAGQTNITFEDCLYGLMVASGCEAANILALNICLTVEDFVMLMNIKAKEIGCKNTHFSNPHGLWEEDNYSTPYDMYLITKYAYQNVPGFMDYCDAYSHDFPANKYNPDGYTKYTTNPLINANTDFYLDYVHGVKTGSIDTYIDKNGEEHPVGRSLVTTAQKNGYTYILVTMEAPYYNDNGERYNYNALDHYRLYEWAYDNFINYTVVSPDDIISQVAVDQGEGDRVQLVSNGEFSTLIPKDLAESLEESSDTESPVQKKVTLLYSNVTAPVRKGEILGKLEINYQGETVKTIDLVASNSVERSQMAFLTDRAASLPDTNWFVPLLVLLGLCIVLLFVLLTVRRRKLIQEARKKERMRRRNLYK